MIKENLWAWLIAVLVLGSVAITYDRFDYFLVFTLAFILAKQIEILNKLQKRD